MCYFFLCICFSRVSVNDKEVKVNIFDMAGHPVFYEVIFVCSLFRHQLDQCGNGDICTVKQTSIQS